MDRGDLWQYLRIVRKPYRKRYGCYERRGKIKNKVSINERPEIVDKKARIGDWEGNTIIGKDKKSVLLTLVERKALYLIIIKLNKKQASEVAEATVKALYPLKQKVKTMTFDNGLELNNRPRKIRGGKPSNGLFKGIRTCLLVA